MDDPGFYLDRDLMFPIYRVEVRDAMLVVKHAYHDAEETGNLGHKFLNGLNNLLSGARDPACRPIPLQTDHSRFHASAQTKVSVAVEHKLVASGEFLIQWAAPDASLY